MKGEVIGSMKLIHLRNGQMTGKEIGKPVIKSKINCDKIVLICAESYIVLPVIVFMFGWMKTVYAIIGCILIVGLSIRLYEALGKNCISLISRKNFTFWITAIILSAIWVYLSGIGGFAYQNSDHWVRNPIFSDLSTYSWPVIYDLSAEPQVVKSICGDGEVAFSYYFSWWLPVCFVAKLFHLSSGLRNVLLYIWALTGILLTVYLICRKLGKVWTGGGNCIYCF